MFVDVIDYHGHHVKINAAHVMKLRPAIVAGDPQGCTLIDFVSGGVFARGELSDNQTLFAPFIRLAELHAPDKVPVLINADGIAAVLGPDPNYVSANSVAVVAPGFENQNVPARNRIPLNETPSDAEAALAAATVRGQV